MSDPVEAATSRLETLLGLDPRMAKRAVQETLDCFTHGVDDFIASRHSELRGQGLANTDVYERIAKDLRRLRFTAPPLTARQIRRRIYG